MSDALSELALQAPADPDAQATVTDFLDYTEYLPSDLARSLTLIRKFDDIYVSSSSQVHELAKSYGALPSAPAQRRLDPQTIRSQMSSHLSRALDMRGAALAEADRLHEIVDHHYNRLASIITKLQAMPQPPSRDTTPTPRPSASPQTQRSRTTRQAGDTDAPAPRITLRLDGARSSVQGGRQTSQASRRKASGREAPVSGEALPPRGADSDSSSSESGWGSSPPSPMTLATNRAAAASRNPRSTPRPTKPSKRPKTPKAILPKAARDQGQRSSSGPDVKPGERVRLTASIPSSELKPPPPDAVAGSEDAPWLKLTPWEMAKLRKRMKKNAVWCPSETMIRRELAELGRGPEAYHAAKVRAEESGAPFVDSANIAGTGSSPGKRVLAEGEISADSLGRDEMKLSNRGMKLNEAKKLKKEIMQKEAAAQAAAEAEPGYPPREDESAEQGADGIVAKQIKNRKRDSSSPVAPVEAEKAESKAKRRKRDGHASTGATKAVAKTANTTTTTTVPLAAPGPSTGDSALEELAKAANSGPYRRIMSAASKAATPDRTAVGSRSRGTTASADPQMAAAGKDRPRRASTISAVLAAEAALPVRQPPRRSKRPVPGRLTGDGGPAVTVGQRTAAPRKKNGAKRPKSETQGVEDRVDDVDEEGFPIDPDEPRYCFCGDVSFGQMIQCENNDVRLSRLIFSTLPVSIVRFLFFFPSYLFVFHLAALSSPACPSRAIFKSRWLWTMTPPPLSSQRRAHKRLYKSPFSIKNDMTC